jgi:hypothetical protein
MKLLYSLALPLSGPVLQTWLALLLVRKGAVRTFKFFFAYTVFAVIAEFVKIALAQRDFHLYVYAFLVTQPIYALLGFLSIAEVFSHVFKNFYRIWWFRFVFPSFGVLAVATSVLIAVLRPPVQANAFIATLFVLEIIVRCLQLGVFLLIIVLANFYELFWRQHSFGIATGFGVAALGILVATLVRSIFGTTPVFVLKFLPPLSYLAAVLIWLISFAKPLPPDPLGDVRPLFTPELMRELAERYRKLIRDIFELCWESSQ